VSLRLVYLAEPAEVVVAADQASLESFRAFFRRSVESMRAKVHDLETNTALREAFPLTDDIATCAACAFRRPCGRVEAVREFQRQHPAVAQPIAEPTAES
jgi:hypothetical protein